MSLLRLDCCLFFASERDRSVPAADSFFPAMTELVPENHPIFRHLEPETPERYFFLVRFIETLLIKLSFADICS